MHTLLETERLVLRQFTLADADNLLELNSDPDVIRFVTIDKQADPTIIQTQILPKWLQHYEDYEGYGFWAAIEKSSRAFIGWFFLRPAIHAPYFDPALANSDDIELGYRLRKESWGQGYATEGSKALIVKGFSELGAQRIVAIAFAANMASIKVLEKSGLKLKKQFIDENMGQEIVFYALNHDR